MKASDYGIKPHVSVGAWSFSEPDRENWDGPHLDTREDAIAAGRAHFGPGVPFEVGRFAEAEVDAPYADWVLDEAVCQMGDQVPSDTADHFLDAVSASEKQGLTDALQAAFASWLTATDNWPTFCKVDDIERIEPLPPTAGAGAAQP